ncbi:MAG: efflux transporter outer membrane subunit [Janthinobacterium lividum]
MRRGLPSAALSLLTLAACTVGPNYHLPQQALLNQGAAQGPLLVAPGANVSADPVPDDWWRLYDDPALTELVDKALRANTDLRVASANLARARATVDEAGAAGGFSAATSATVRRAQEAGQAYLLNEKLPVAYEGDAGLTVSYEFDLFGKLARGVEAARADADVTQAAGDLARITVVADVVRAYAQACAAGEEMQIAERSVALQNQSTLLARRLRAAGRVNLSDVTRSQTQSDTLRADLPRFVADKQAALYRLAVLTGGFPGQVPDAVAQCQRTPTLTQTIPVGDGAALLKRRPDVREAERRLALATARIGVATAALYPTISLGASAGVTGVGRDLGRQETQRFGFGPLISWNIPANGARARIHEAQAGSVAALASFDGVVLKALAETDTRLGVYAGDLARTAALQAALQSAQQTAAQTHAFYQAGRVSSLVDLDAQRTLAGAEASLATSQAKVASDQVDLFLALGGGWQSAQSAQAQSAPAAPTEQSAQANQAEESAQATQAVQAR